VHHLTGAPSSRASADACGPPPYPVWLSPGVPYLTVVCGGSKSDRHCGLPVLFALQRVPHRASLSHRGLGRTYRSRWAALHRGAVAHLHALAHTLAECHTPKSPTGLWRVPHAVELCGPRRDAPGQTWHPGVCGNGTPLAPRTGRGMETSQ